MELKKLIDTIWKMIEAGELDGDKIPDLDLCNSELHVLTTAYAEKKMLEDSKY